MKNSIFPDFGPEGQNREKSCFLWFGSSIFVDFAPNFGVPGGPNFGKFGHPGTPGKTPNFGPGTPIFPGRPDTRETGVLKDPTLKRYIFLQKFP